MISKLKQKFDDNKFEICTIAACMVGAFAIYKVLTKTYPVTLDDKMIELLKQGKPLCLQFGADGRKYWGIVKPDIDIFEIIELP